MANEAGNAGVNDDGNGGMGAARQSQPVSLREHIVEIVSDAGEGAQKAGQSFGTVCAKMGNGT